MLSNPSDRHILAVAVPAFFALITEPLMLLADTAIVGHLGTSQLGGLAAASVVLSTIVGLCIFLAYGSTAAVSRHHGAGDARGAFSLAISGLWLALTLGAVLAATLAFWARPLADAFASSPQVADHAHTYLWISALSVPAMLLVLSATGGLRGSLDLRTPLTAMICANLLNVVASFTLVYGCGLGIAGAAIGTVIAQWFGAAWLCAVLVRRARVAHAATRPQWGEIGRAALAGVPLLVRTATLRASLILGTLVASGLGDATLAAHQIVGTLVVFLAFALDAIAIAGQTLTGRALGASDVPLTRALTARMIWWGWWSGALLGVALAAVSPWIARGFSSDPAVLDTVVPALLVAAVLQPISGIVFVLDGVLIGAGDGTYLAVAGVVVLIAYIPLALAVEWTGAGFTWLWIAYGGFMVARLATLWHRQRGDAWMTLGAA